MITCKSRSHEVLVNKRGSMSFINGIKGAFRGVKRVQETRKTNPGLDNPSNNGQMYCKACGTQSRPTTETPGSILIEVVLWLCFLIPGLIYSLWRLNRRHQVCPKCGSEALIPPDSPIALSEKRKRQE